MLINLDPRGPGPPLKILLFLELIVISSCNTSLNYDDVDIEENLTEADLEESSEFQFTSLSYNATIGENSVGKVYVESHQKMGIFNADPDVNIKYKIVGGDHEFFFKAESEQVGNFVFLLIRTRTGNINVLNRERTESYQLTVRATFRDSTRHRIRDIKARTVVNVQILDTNDLDPFFNPSSYRVSVPEDHPLHASILRVNAEDADSGINGEIYYSIAEDTDMFTIHPVSGLISLARNLVYSEKPNHRITVEARDRGTVYSYGPRRVDTATVSISVEQVNKFDPIMKIQHLPEVVEQSHTDIYAIIHVTDPDPGPHGEVAGLEIIEGDPDAHFRVRPGADPSEFNIEVLKLLDREIAPKGYNLTLKATDNGIPPRSSYKEVHVRLADLNDHPPVFDKEEYEVRIPESALPNTPLTRLKVTDLDSGRNAKVVLKITAGNPDDQFRIDPLSGVLFVARPLDAETKSRYTLTVSALDMANAGMRKQSSARVSIFIDDVNDNTPEFENKEKEIFFNENEPTGTRVMRLNAQDLDSGENSRITYSIVNIHADELPFEIDHFTGVIKSRSVIDYESARRDYDLIIRASDWGTPFRRESEMKLMIHIKDINDNRPQFERDGCIGKVSRSLPLGGEIITLSALDYDVRNIISYRVVSGNADGCFYLDETTGVLSAKCDLGRLPMKRRILNVTATDGQHFADVMPIELNLVETEGFYRDTSLEGRMLDFNCRNTNVAQKLTELMAEAEKNNRGSLEPESTPVLLHNIHFPSFQRLPKSFYLNETDPVGTEVFKVNCEDLDPGFEGFLVYAISGGDPDAIFEINMTSGVVRLMAQADREKTQDYMLNITACDLGIPQKCSSILSHVIVVDQNDNSPVFIKSAFSFFFPENTRNGTPVVTLNATDLDSGPFGQVTYVLETETEDFSLDPSTGLLIVSKELDRETKEFYDLTIRAVDGDLNAPLSSLAKVRVRVLDVNDVAPRFTSQEYYVKAREDLPVGTVVGFVDAYDPDLYQGGQITYSIDYGAEDMFYIDKFTGAIKIKKQLDYETKQLYNLTVLAIDGGSPSLVSVSSFIVEVLDVNENQHPPRFDSVFESARVPENLPPGSLVTKIAATDFDTGTEDRRVSYSIRGGDGLNSFTIDDSGNIKTSVVLDRESKSNYWLTVYAQDHGSVPLFSKLEIFIEVLNINDNIPLTLFPVYFPSVPENSKPSTPIVTLEAFDGDWDPEQKLVFEITSGDPQSLFTINSITGQIFTTHRKLDREVQSEHELEIRVSDSSQPPLNSTTKVIVSVLDENDNTPQFLERYYKIKLPEILLVDESLQKDQETLPAGQNKSMNEAKYDPLFENTTWETFNIADLGGKPVFRVIALDKDEGLNSKLSYSINNGVDGTGRFQVNPETGTVHTTISLLGGEMFELLVECKDGGNPQLSDVSRVSVEIIPTEPDTNQTISIQEKHNVEVFETDPVGHLVILLQPEVEIDNFIFFEIVGGNDGFDFTISGDKGSLLIANPLDWERQGEYSLNVSISDGAVQEFTLVHIKVIDVHEDRPEFSAAEFLIDVPENFTLNGEITRLTLTDRSAETKKLFSVHAAQSLESFHTFKIDPIDGTVSLARKLDREQISRHILTVSVKDEGSLSKKNFARLVINVEDNNDHSPQFLSQLIQTKLFETADIGSSVVQALAIDNDHGENGRITYSILTGNVGNSFFIDPDLGILRVARELDIRVQPEYMLVLKATDNGMVPLSATLPVHILLTMADSAPPRFLESHYATEVYENLARGHFVIHVEARSQSSLFYEISSGNQDGVFKINPSTGIIMTQQNLDFEKTRVYNLIVQVSNMVGAKTSVGTDIHVLDINDNSPMFKKNYFEGNISESASVGSLVLTDNTTPLVIKATDEDSGLNSLLMYEILGDQASKYFTIDSSTGALRTILNLDFETQSVFEFNVRVSDMGKPRLSAETTAHVKLYVKDENDSPPRFSNKVYDETLLLPTFKNVSVVQVNASDPDKEIFSTLQYSIAGGNLGDLFGLDERTGRIFVNRPDEIEGNPRYSLDLMVSDGKFTDLCRLNIDIRKSENSGLAFSKSKYYATVLENSTKSDVILVVNVLGSALNENLEFFILNPTDLFNIGRTSGALSTTGKVFDREKQENYELILEVRSEERARYTPRIAHVVVDVTVMDLNDNPPMFVNKPYYAVISRESERDTQVIQVMAVDLDKGSNGDIYYQLVRGNGDLFRVGRKSGRITLKRTLNSPREDYILTIAAYDGGSPPYSSETQVLVKIVEKSVPTFSEQSYKTSVPENAETFSPILTTSAVSPTKGELIYTLETGNELEIFSVDHSAGVLFVTEGLDYETRTQHQLTLRATDTISSGYSESIIFISVEDVNDCSPRFLNDSYFVSVSEAQPHGSRIIQVQAKDLDSGVNQEIEYSLMSGPNQFSDLFSINPNTGEIFLLRNLDYEREKSHHLKVFATDKGTPPRTGDTTVQVYVEDSNDNPPGFEEAEYQFYLSNEANRGQFVGKVRAVDPDFSDNTKLLYSIIGGNEHQIFSIEEKTGMISLVNLHNFDKVPTYLLNITVSDGVYATTTKVKINLYSGNRHNPVFEKSVVEVKFRENSPEKSKIVRVFATDLDGDTLKYTIISDESNKLFGLNPDTGELINLKILDREEKDNYDIPVMVSDMKGRNGFSRVKITITDENDNMPVFPLSDYKVNIPANLTAGSQLLQVTAEDKDIGRNAHLKYSIYDTRSSGVDDVLKINKENGQIFLKKGAKELENEVYQFFVRAEDGGKETLHSDIPVEVYIMSPVDHPPRFEKRDSIYLVDEGSPVGRTITQLSAVSAPDSQIQYKIASTQYSGPDTLFQVDNSGRVIISNLLDRETAAVHKVVILAETDSSPTLNAYTTLTIQLLDNNDNSPEFISSMYEVTVSESVSPHTSILQVLATDLDFSNNGEVTYSFAEESKHLAPLFNIDPHNGWITTQGSLDYEQTESYIITIQAKDNGKESRTTETKVHVNILDTNDNPPEFSQRQYSAAVNEGALPGTIIFQLQVRDGDKDAKSQVAFSITNGDTRGRFQIKQNGEVYVARSLDREETAEYRLEVTATDGLFVTSCRVSIEILDDNDSPPTCTQYNYRQEVSEGILPGTNILRVYAEDQDEGQNARQVFSLLGETKELFSIDPDSGLVTTSLLLDREKIGQHLLTVRVEDAGNSEWFCESKIELTLTDTNDNRPKWDTDEFSVSIPEDANIGQILTKVHATDSDLGENRIITYSFLDSAEGQFEIESRNGLITLAKGLDRETVDLYNLTVRAMDSGRPRLTAITNLLVRILDVNDNPPEFASKYYFATVTEGVLKGTDVVRLLASSRDTGVNAEIRYSISGGNQHNKFTIDPFSGLVSVAGEIDHERAREYFLTIMAEDGGTPPLNNHATVNITVLDANDNPPIFTLASYSANINEKSPVGRRIISLTATDLDKGMNGKIVYELVHGDRLEQFRIDPNSGELFLHQSLDREMVSSYVLEVQARDHGDPVLTSSVLVNVKVEDANDNPPVFPEGNYTVYVQEDKPYGHILLTFSVTDADESPNGVPFSWDIRAGNEDGGFRMVQDGSLRTAKKFNHKLRTQYILQIRVFDNGAQPLYSDTYVTVNIIEESQYPPVLTPLEVEVFSFQDEFPGSVIGKVHSSDQDPYDVLGYEIVPAYSVPNMHYHLRMFEIDRRTGTLLAIQGLDVGEYNLNISVSDGKYVSFQKTRVTVNLVTETVLQNSVVIKFSQVSPEEFIRSYKKNFVGIVKNLFNVRSKDVEVLGLQPTFTGERGTRTLEGKERRETEEIIKNQLSRQPNLELLLAVKRDNSIHFSRDEVRKSLNSKLLSVSAQVGLKILEIREELCEETSCLNGKCRGLITMSESQVVTVATDVSSLVFPQFEYSTICECKVGFSGEHCDKIANECHREPCPSFKVCVPDQTPEGYSCLCPTGFTGTACTVNISTCAHSKCTVVNPIQFSGRSYAQYTLKRTVERHLSVSIGFKTLYSVATLMYAQGLVDYSILEISDGKLQYRFNFGSGEGLVRLNEKIVNDGEWHEVKLERHGNSAELAVDGKWRVHGAAPGLNDVLNLDQSEVFFGADTSVLDSSKEGRAVTRGFVGCMDDIKLDHEPVPLYVSGDSPVAKLKRFMNIEFKCEALLPPGVCGSHPCKHGGTCLELDTPSGFACTCPARFSGATCEYDLDPCFSNPCLHGAKCVNLKNDYHCECPTKLSGKRCHYGKYCNPNPCENKGVCEEGQNGPICKCRGFTGEFCTIDVNECQHQNPCHNGGTCVNSPGGFHCICSGNSTGVYCSESAHVSLVPRTYALTLEEVVGIILSLFIIVIIVALFVGCSRLRSKRDSRARNNTMNMIQNDINRDTKKKGRNGVQKMNNYELTAREQDIPLLPQRPVSISPSVSETPFNYMDTVRSYGSAADELETLPRLPNDYFQNIQKPIATVAPSMIADRDMNLKDNYFLRKKSPGLDSTRPSSSSSYMFRANKLRVNLPPDGEETCQSELSMEDDCQRYHWDCSDWANQTTLPAMSELPNGEILENCSWLSGIQRNSSQGINQADRPFNPVEPVDPTRDIETLPEDDTETPEDPDGVSQYNSECESQLGAVYPDEESPVHETNKSIEELMMINGVNYVDDDEDSVEIPNSYDYKLHLNNYLPTYHLGSDPDTDEATPMLGRHQMGRLYQQRSPDLQRYAVLGVSQPPISQAKNSVFPVRGAVLSLNKSGEDDEDQVCDIEDAGEENEASAFRRTPSPRVTQV